MSFYQTLVNRLKGIRFSTNINISKQYVFGGIYQGSYSNYKRDPNPLIFCMWSGINHKGSHVTHGLNIHYLNEQDKIWLARSIFMIKKYNQNMDGRVFYKYLKIHRMSIIRSCYRLYYTKLTQFKLVSAGLTPLDHMVYPSNEKFVIYLNNVISKSQLMMQPKQVAYSQTELQERIIESLNTRQIQRGTQETTGNMGRAGWLR